MARSVAQAAFDAGVVGAGGATHVKLAARAEFFLVNGAECEPLLHRDKELLKHAAATVIRGAILAAESVGAKRVICGIKEKFPDVVDAETKAVAGTGVEILPLGNDYPSGDEYNLTYEATGRLIPPMGNPLDVACVVANVETLYNVALAVSGAVPVTESLLTIAGRVTEPITLRVPIGTPISEVLALAGMGSEECVVLDGGAMMGDLRDDLSYPVTRTSGGYIALPRDHYLIKRRFMTKSDRHRKGHSACDQCTYCTEFCPRYLLGCEVEPHKVMRSLLFAGGQQEEYWSRWGQLCCECNLCSLYACPEDLDPKDACVWSKDVLRKSQAPQPEWKQPEKTHAFEEHRKVPFEKLVRRLGLESFDHPAPWQERLLQPQRVRIPLKQHIGTACEPAVSTGDVVEKGQVIGHVPDGELGAPVHASIAGRVREINDSVVLERT